MTTPIPDRGYTDGAAREYSTCHRGLATDVDVTAFLRSDLVPHLPSVTRSSSTDRNPGQYVHLDRLAVATHDPKVFDRLAAVFTAAGARLREAIDASAPESLQD